MDFNLSIIELNLQKIGWRYISIVSGNGWPGDFEQ